MFSIMVADDEQLERRVLTSILKKNVRVKEIIEAKNGKEALELNREFNPDIIIMDIKMPGINGIKALELIKNENPNKEIIMLTAYDDFEFIHKVLVLGGSDYIIKPIKPDKKYSIVKNIFNKDFIISAIIPLLIYGVATKCSTELIGLILSGIWCIAVVIVNYFMSKTINFLATIGAVFNGIGLIGTIISKSPTFYLATPIVEDFLFAFILIMSIFLSHPIIQVVAEQSFLNNVPKSIKDNPKYKSSWNIITAAWAAINILQATVRIIILNYFSIKVYYTISNIYSGISIPLFIAASIIFSKWYLTH